MRPEVVALIAGATVALSSALFGLAAKDTNPWFVVLGCSERDYCRRAGTERRQIERRVEVARRVS